MPGRPRDLLIGVEIRTAGKRRKCGRNRLHQIPKGEECLVVRREGRGEKAYCHECAAVILDLVESRTAELRAHLS